MSTEARSVKPLSMSEVLRLEGIAEYMYDGGELKGAVSNLDVVALCKTVRMLNRQLKQARGEEE